MQLSLISTVGMTRAELVRKWAKQVACVRIAEGYSGEYEEVEKQAAIDLENSLRSKISDIGSIFFRFDPSTLELVIERFPFKETQALR